MNKIELNPDRISEIFKDNLLQENTYFVFATDTVMNSWIDWIVTHPELSGTDAVPFEKFIAWDKFKNQYLSASQKNKTAIPTLLRQLFVNDLIQKNAEKPKDQRLKVIINPDDELAKTAESFSDWICNNLKSLKFWKQRLEKYQEEYGFLDDEDSDYEFLYNEYDKFLQQNNLFEPSWIEQVDFENKESRFLIIYPETMQDFDEYTHIFDSTQNITAYCMPEDIPSPKAFVYSDSRKELRTVMLQIIELVQNKKADWSEIALNIPDIDTYRPYIEREFELYQIPYVIKSGLSLTKNCAGRIFREIYSCYNDNFTFDSVRTLLLDECVPWKEEFESVKEALIREGNQMRCICSPYETNIWLSALTTKINHLNKPEDSEQKVYYENLKKFFMDLQKSINRFFNPEKNTFENIKNSWMEFKHSFLQDEAQFSEEANNILSRCIKELDSIIQIENDFANCGLKTTSPFDFYLTLLDSKTYTPQTKQTGVNIFKYKLAAAAYFKYQFVIDSSQKNLEIPQKRLSFLNATKRQKLHLVEEDSKLNPTKAHINLYAKKTETADDTFVHFSVAKNTFDGYAIPHSILQYKKNDPDLPNLDSKDFILNEKYFIQTPEFKLNKINPFQKEMFNNWTNSSLQTQENYHLSSKMEQLIERRKGENKKFNISARGDLENFFPCPRKWFLSSVLKFHDDTLDTNLMKPFEMGTLNHKILELFLSNYINLPLPVYDKDNKTFTQNKDGQLIDCKNEIYSLTEELSKNAIKQIYDFKDAPLVIHTLEDQIHKLQKTINDFLMRFLLPYNAKQNGFGNCIVFALEKQFIQEFENYNYKGIVDCILKTPDSGDLIIVDFKNSSNAIPQTNKILVDPNTELLANFQMPVYYSLVTSNTNNDVDAGLFISIKKGQTSLRHAFKNKSAGDKSFGEFEPSIEKAKEYSEEFVKIAQSKNFIPTQSDNDKEKINVKPYETCNECAFKTFCRTTYNVGTKKVAEKGDKNE